MKQGKEKSDNNTAMADTATKVMIGLIVACFGIAFALSWFIIRAVMMQLGYDPDYVAQVTRKVAIGDLNFEIDIKGKNEGSLIVAMHQLVTNIKALVTDTAMLNTAAIEGKLSTRADSSKHQGDYQKIIKGVNDCLDSVTGPLRM